MAAVRFAQLELDLPVGWEARGFSRVEDGEGERTYSVLHVANFALPAQVADYGGGAVERMGPSHVFIALLEFGPESAGTPLFEPTRVPVLERGSFDPGVLHRGLQGQSATQHFFTVKGRPYCLYAVLGDHLLRFRAAPAVNEVLRNLRFLG
jgi:hypothetical protein